MTDLLTAMATPAWAYLAIFGFLTVDAMVPVVPIQAIMITSGALTVYGNLSLPVVIAVGALGMFAGDSIAFVLGRSAGRRVGGHWLSHRLAQLRGRFEQLRRLGADDLEIAFLAHIRVMHVQQLQNFAFSDHIGRI